jgi:transglutaminase-like putative cysteine protease
MEKNNEVEEENDNWYKGPIKFILVIFLILLIVLWFFPSYSVKLDPEPKYVAKIDEVISDNIEIGNVSNELKNYNDFRKFVKPNDPVIKRVADRIVSLSGCGSNRVCQAKAIFYFVRDNFDYVSDPYTYEYVKSARESLLSRNGDCEDGSLLIANLLEAIGIKTRFVFIPKHVFVQVYIPEALNKYKIENNWINLDTTCDNCGFGEIPWRNIGKNTRYLSI